MRTVLNMNTYGIKMRGNDSATKGAKNSTRPNCDVTSSVRVSWSRVVVGTCVEIKLQAPHAIDAMLCL